MTHKHWETFDLRAYAKRQLGLLRRAKKLPEDKLEILAREALKRLAERDVSLSAKVSDTDPSEEELTQFCEVLISDDDTAAANFILGLNAQNASPEFVYLKYLAAAAQLLGVWWEQDRVGFLASDCGHRALVGNNAQHEPSF